MAAINLDDLDRDSKALMFVLGAVSWLHQNGCIAGRSNQPTTVIGDQMWDQLEASGFRPTYLEAASCLRFLRENGVVPCDDETAGHMLSFLMKWDKIKEYVKEDQS